MVDSATNAVIDTVSVGSELRSAVVTCNGAYAHGANDQGSSDISKISASDTSRQPG